VHFDHIYVSDLGRTVATFENIKGQAKYLEKIPTVFTKVIREKSGGVLEGKPLITWKQMADKEHKSVREYRCEKGESWSDVNKRCY
jgi:broad specificity phosphatase PhoE